MEHETPITASISHVAYLIDGLQDDLIKIDRENVHGSEPVFFTPKSKHDIAIEINNLLSKIELLKLKEGNYKLLVENIEKLEGYQKLLISIKDRLYS